MLNFKSTLSFIIIVSLTIACKENTTIDGSNFIYRGKVKTVTSTYYEIANGDTSKLNKGDSLIAFMFVEEFDSTGNTLIQTYVAPGLEMIDEYKYEKGKLNQMLEKWDNNHIKREYRSIVTWKDDNNFKGVSFDSETKMTSVFEVALNKDKSKKSKLVYSTFNRDTVSRTLYLYNSSMNTNSYSLRTKKYNREKVDTTFFVTKVMDGNRNAIELIQVDNNLPIYYLTKDILYY